MTDGAAGEGIPRRLFVYSGGFLRQRRLRRILALAGHELRLGWPGRGDGVAVWGRRGPAARGAFVAARAGVPLVTIEDAFLRSVRPGRAGEPPLGLLIDGRGVHFDASRPSDLEHLLASHPLDDPALLARAAAGMARLRDADLSKYNVHDPAAPLPAPGHVLVIDQTRGDASIAGAGADAGSFARMLAAARAEHPGARIVIKTHPETAAGHRAGHFGPQDGEILTAPVSPWRLLEGAAAVYAVSSQLGFEAILAGHRPRLFGQPFYAGWGLSDDRLPVPRRGRPLSAAQLFAGAMLLYPRWHDPYRDRPCSFEEVCDTLEAQARAAREDARGYVALNMRLWKRRHLGAFFRGGRGVRFGGAPRGRRVMVWGSAPGADLRVEDGFLRSRGLGAELVPPVSLVLDDLGIYYDPGRESRLERLIAAGPGLPGHARARAERLIAALLATGVSKYNLGGAAPVPVPPGRRVVLVPGQVEDDASIRLGAGAVRSNLALLAAARAANADAWLIYKPHPDVEAGLRPGAVPEAEALRLADHVATRADPVALIAVADEVWTMTSSLGFEALLRGRRVVCLGTPFYAGWGLTRDLAPVPARRGPGIALAELAHAALIAYPRYRDPVSGLPCPPEVIVERLASGAIPHPGRANRLLAKLQGLLAGRAHLWR